MAEERSARDRGEEEAWKLVEYMATLLQSRNDPSAMSVRALARLVAALRGVPLHGHEEAGERPPQR